MFDHIGRENDPNASRRRAHRHPDRAPRPGGTIDPKGRPMSVTVTECANAFHTQTLQASMKWRFRPDKIGGESEPARTSAGIRYTIR